MKTGILGSSFDPPHLGHVLMAVQAKEVLNLDQVWLMPCFLHPFAKKVSEEKHRLAMTRLLKDENIKVSDFEIKQKGVSYSINTLNSLAKLFPKNKFYWIIGSDQIDEFTRWKNWQEIINQYHLIIFPRESVDLLTRVKKALRLKTIPKNIIILSPKDLILTNISSTQIRKRVKEEKSIKYLVPESVEKYIIEHKLYKNA